MKRSEAAKYARWSALVALVLALITGGYYVRRQWVAFKEKKQAPPPLTEDKERQSIGLTLSKNEADRTIFTLQASKSTDFKGQDISLLEDVKVTVFGKTGERHDVLHTQSCRYSKADGAIQCAGNVQMDLQSAADFERAKTQSASKANVIHVETSAVTFERGTGRAQTVQPVKFTFTNGEGEGLGAVYFSEEGALRLVKDVHIKVRPPAPAAGARGNTTANLPATKEVLLMGTSLDLGKLTHKAVLAGPATATTSAQQLTAGEFTLLLDEQFRAQTIFAEPGKLEQTPKMVSTTSKEPETLTANEIKAELAPEGWVRTVDADGQVRGSTPNDQMQADHGTVEMWPKVNQAKLVTLRGNAIVEEHDAKNGTSRKVTSNSLQLTMSGGHANEKSKIQHAETLDLGTMEWTDTAAAQSKLTADKLTVDFGAATGKAQHLTAIGNVETQRDLKGRPTQTATAENGDAQLDEAGGWTQMALHGKVRMKEGERSAEAQQAVFVRANQTAVLTGQAVARDASSETRATRITFQQNSGDMVAEGKVRSTDLSSKNGGLNLSSAPANISADHMTGNTKSGKALYTGHARLWQGPSVMEADSIELLRDTRILNATGNVRAVFPQANANNAPATTDKAKAPAIWHVSSATLTYWDNENRAHLEKDVVVQSTDERMRGPVLDLYFTKQPTASGGSTSQIERAVSTGGVVVEQGDRRGTAEKGVYTAEDKKFVLSGGTPTLYDAEEGTTTGRELTFNLADDTIIVDSGNGSRTLTKHRVQR